MSLTPDGRMVHTYMPCKAMLFELKTRRDAGH